MNYFSISKQKRFLGLALALVMIIGLLTPCAYASEENGPPETTGIEAEKTEESDASSEEDPGDPSGDPSGDLLGDQSDDGGENEEAAADENEETDDEDFLSQVDKSDLQELIEAAEETVETGTAALDVYTTDSWQALLNALTYAQSTYEAEEASQEDVDRAASALSEALAGLLPVSVLADDVPAAPVSWQPSGKALKITVTQDIRVKLTALATEQADGAYEISFHTGEAASGSIGFLARYAGEASYAGVSIDCGSTGTYTWGAHYSLGLTSRANTPQFTEPLTLTPNTDYRVRIEYNGTDVKVYRITGEETSWTLAGDYTQSGDNCYTGSGGLAIRINPGTIKGAAGCGNVIIDNIVQYSVTNGAYTEVAKIDFNDVAVGQYANYEARGNKKENVDSSLATVEVIDLDAADKTALQAAISAAQAKKETDYTAESWNAFQKALTDAQTVAAKENATQGEVDAAVSALNSAMTALVEKPPEDLDPGLPPVDVSSGSMDRYTQNLTADTSSLGGSDAVNINQAAWGMSGKAMIISTGDDYRVKLTGFTDMTDGAYEVTFRTGSTAPSNSLGFLARYVDESKYAGVSIDSGGNTWAGHYSTSLDARQNPALTNHLPLQPNTTYKVRLEYSGNTVTVKRMQEGESDWTAAGSYTISGGYTGAGGFAIRIRAGYKYTFDNIIQYDAAGQVVKEMSFDDGNAPAYEVRKNKSNDLITSGTTFTTVDIPASETVAGFAPGRGTRLTGSGVFVDTASPVVSTGTYTVQLNGAGNNFGLVFNYKDESNYATIQYSGSEWIAGGKVNGNVSSVSLSSASIPAPTAGETHTYRLEHTASGYTLTISGSPGSGFSSAKTYDLGELSGICTEKGRVGVINGGSGTLFAGPIEVVYTLESVEIEAPLDAVTIRSDEMTVAVGSTFPHIYNYKDASGKTTLAYGAIGETSMDMVVNDQTYAATSRQTSKTENSITYEISIDTDDLAAVFTVKLTVTGKILRMDIPQVTASKGTVRTFCFADGRMISLAGLGVGSALSRINGWGPSNDIFLTTKSGTASTTEQITYALLYDTVSQSVAAIENNAESSEDKYTVKVTSDDVPYISVSNKRWAWQYYDTIAPEPAWAEVVIGGDENEDGQITWQDAGIAYREIMVKAFGWENVKNEWMYIAMNMSSQTSQPFLRVLDTAKAISYLTDGFGFKIMNKGYQAGGHDDTHGQYDFIGIQQGGVEDFNKLINVGLEYGIKNGVHINATEFSLDSTAAVLENMRFTNGNLVKNWNWFDQAYLIDKSKDVSTLSIQKRLQAFENLAPNLDFYYVDVYQSGSNYDSTQFLKKMNELGATVGTEALGDFNQGITFVHWNTDLYYGTGGDQSQVLRFVTFGVGDLSAPDRATLGALMPGIADWRNTNNFSEAQSSFYRNNLPSKYLQHFALESWRPDESAEFSGGVRTAVTTEGSTAYTSIYKDEKLIAKINTSSIKLYDGYSGKPNPGMPSAAEIFIPWSPEVEDKIYCYTDYSGSKEWALPDSWSGVTTAYLYPLTTSGRGTPQAIIVSGGKVTLNLTVEQPYVLVKTQEQQAHRYNADGSVMTSGSSPVYLPTLEQHPWGEGSAITNFGFTGGTLEGWTVTPAAGTTADVTLVSTPLANQAKGDPRVQIAASFAGSISQSVPVTPGKTYTFSVWTSSTGQRPVTLTASAGDVTKTASIDTTAGFNVTMRPSKYNNSPWQRLRVAITIPDGVTRTELSLSTVAGDAPVLVDDFRSFEWTGTVNPRAQYYYYYEDFENLDENWGPFVSNVSNQPYIHLSYKFPDGRQTKWYTVDTGEADNLTSLKGQQTGAFGTVGGTDGVMMRTLESTLKFERGDTYTVEFEYQTYRELRAQDGTNLAGYNVPLAQSTYSIDVRKADGTLISTHPLEPSTFETTGYNARPSTETISFTVDATEEEGIFLTFRKTADLSSVEPIFAIDNFRVTKGQHSHTLEHVERVEPTATEDGNIEYWYCAACGKYFRDAEAAAEISQEETVLKATGSQERPPIAPDPFPVLPGVADEPFDTSSDDTPSAPVLDVTTGTKVDATTTTARPTAAVSNGTAYATISDEMAAEMVRQAAEGGSDIVTVIPKISGSVTGTEVTIPASAVSSIAEETNAGLKVETPAASVTIPNGALTAMDGDVTVFTGSSNAAVEISIRAGGQQMDRIEGGIEVEIPAECGPGTVAMLVDADGKEVSLVRKSSADSSGQTMHVPLDGSARVVIVDNSRSFSDVPSSNWAADAIAFASSHELMNGVSETSFGPSESMTRGMLAVVLHNLENNPVVAYSGSFQDVAGSAWYASAVHWAAAQNIITGVSEGVFAPERTITREELAVMLYRYADCPSIPGNEINRFTDAGSVSSWAREAMNWAVSCGIINGSGGALNPRSSATRAEVAQMLMNFVSGGNL